MLAAYGWSVAAEQLLPTATIFRSVQQPTAAQQQRIQAVLGTGSKLTSLLQSSSPFWYAKGELEKSPARREALTKQAR